MGARPCRRCKWLLQAPARELVLFDFPQMDRCHTDLWYQEQALRIRSMAIAMHARAGHPA